MPLLETLVPQALTVCTYTRFAPFSFEQSGEIVWTDIALLTRFAQSEGLHARFEVSEFPDIWKRPGQDQCDIAAAGIAALEERDPGQGGCWSESYTIVRRSLLIRKSDIDTLRTPKDFAGRSIVATSHSTADIDSRQRYEGLGAEIIPDLPIQDEMVRRLLAGEIDAYAGGETSNRFVAESEPQLAVVDVHSMEPPETLHFAVRHKDPRLLEHLNAFIMKQLETSKP